LDGGGLGWDYIDVDRVETEVWGFLLDHVLVQVDTLADRRVSSQWHFGVLELA
jgi:hypothetical protein